MKFRELLTKLSAFRQTRLFVTPREARNLVTMAQRTTLAQTVNIKLNRGSRAYEVRVTVPRHALETDVPPVQAANAIGFEVAAQLLRRHGR